MSYSSSSSNGVETHSSRSETKVDSKGRKVTKTIRGGTGQEVEAEMEVVGADGKKRRARSKAKKQNLPGNEEL